MYEPRPPAQPRQCPNVAIESSAVGVRRLVLHRTTTPCAPAAPRAADRDLGPATAKAPLQLTPSIHWLEIELAPQSPGDAVVLGAIGFDLPRPRDGQLNALLRDALAKQLDSGKVPVHAGSSTLRWLVPAGPMTVQPLQSFAGLRRAGGNTHEPKLPAIDIAVRGVVPSRGRVRHRHGHRRRTRNANGRTRLVVATADNRTPLDDHRPSMESHTDCSSMPNPPHRRLKSVPRKHANAEIVPEGARRCPICQQPMQTEKRGSEAADVCNDHGIWLDRLELERMVARRGLETGRLISRARADERTRWNLGCWLWSFFDDP